MSQAAIQVQTINSARIDTSENMIFVVVNGKVTAIKPPSFGTVEIGWHNEKVSKAVVSESIKI